jgi:hypothetical protein
MSFFLVSYGWSFMSGIKRFNFVCDLVSLDLPWRKFEYGPKKIFVPMLFLHTVRYGLHDKTCPT